MRKGVREKRGKRTSRFQNYMACAVRILQRDKVVRDHAAKIRDCHSDNAEVGGKVHRGKVHENMNVGVSTSQTQVISRGPAGERATVGLRTTLQNQPIIRPTAAATFLPAVAAITIPAVVAVVASDRNGHLAHGTDTADTELGVKLGGRRRHRRWYVPRTVETPIIYTGLGGSQRPSQDQPVGTAAAPDAFGFKEPTMLADFASETGLGGSQRPSQDQPSGTMAAPDAFGFKEPTIIADFTSATGLGGTRLSQDQPAGTVVASDHNFFSTADGEVEKMNVSQGVENEQAQVLEPTIARLELLAADAELWDQAFFTTDASVENFAHRRYLDLQHGRISMFATLGYFTPGLKDKFPGLAGLGKRSASVRYPALLAGIFGDSGFKELSSSHPQAGIGPLVRIVQMAIIGRFFQDGLTESAAVAFPLSRRERRDVLIRQEDLALAAELKDITLIHDAKLREQDQRERDAALAHKHALEEHAQARTKRAAVRTTMQR